MTRFIAYSVPENVELVPDGKVACVHKYGMLNLVHWVDTRPCSVCPTFLVATIKIEVCRDPSE